MKETILVLTMLLPVLLFSTFSTVAVLHRWKTIRRRRILEHAFARGIEPSWELRPHVRLRDTAIPSDRKGLFWVLVDPESEGVGPVIRAQQASARAYEHARATRGVTRSSLPERISWQRDAATLSRKARDLYEAWREKS